MKTENRARALRPALERAMVVSAILLVASFTYRNMDLLGDSFWYLASGDWVLSHHALPSTDPFAFTSLRSPWVLDYPACQIGFALVARHFGLVSLILLSTLVSVGAGLLLVFPHASSLAARVVGLALVLGSMYVERDDLSARGQIFGDLGVAVLLILLSRARRGERISPLVPLVLAAAWTNLHASFLLAVVTPFAVLLAQLFDPEEERVSSRKLVGFGALSAFGTGLNPYSYVLVVDVLRLSADPTTRHVDLFQSPDFHSAKWLVVVLAAPILMVARLRSRDTTHAGSDVVLLSIALFAGCAARRFGSIAMALEVFVAVRVVSAMPRRKLPTLAETAFLAGGSAVALGLALRWVLEPKDPFAQVPKDAVAYVLDARLPDRIYAPYHWGGYLDYVFAGRRKVFIDGRNQLFSNGTFDDARVIERGGEPALALLEAYEIRTLVVERESPLERLLSRDADFRRVANGRLAGVFVRR